MFETAGLVKGLQILDDWLGQKALMIGAARQGLALTRYLIQHGARVLLNDQRQAEDLRTAQVAMADLTERPDKPLRWAFGGHPLSLLEGIDVVCVTGGAPLEMPLIVEARRRGIKITNDSQIFLAAAPCPVVGITGSAGKTTTTTLVGRIAERARLLKRYSNDAPGKVWVGGNIGAPLISQLDQMRSDDLAVMELSSFQLELMDTSPQIAAILNVTPNHLDRHGTMTAYTAAKARILDFQSPADTAILGRDDPGAWGLRDRVAGRLISFGTSPLTPGMAGIYIDQGRIYSRTMAPGSHPTELDRLLLSTDQISLRGEHNLQNVLAACAVAAALDLPPEAISQGIEGFTGVPHRLELVRRWHGTDWYNDSIATAPERSMAAIRSFAEPLILLAGGRDKDLPWEDFARLVVNRVDHLIVFGEAADKILKAIKAELISSEHQKPAGIQPDQGDEITMTIARFKGLREAVEEAARIAEPGDVVLLSPGGTSFDEFKDFEERGVCFAQWVADLP